MSAYYKVLSAVECRCGYKYHTGLNDLRKAKDDDGDPMFTYFTDTEHVFAYLNYGPIIRSVTIPDLKEKAFKDVIVEYAPEQMVQDGGEIPGWRSNCVILGRPHIIDADIVEMLIAQGARLNVDDYNIASWAITHSKEVWDLISRNYFYPPHEKMIMSILETGGYV